MRIPEDPGRPAGVSLAPRKASLGKRLFPIVIVQAYLAFTVFLFLFGPWVYPLKEPFSLYVFLAFAHGALLLGYLFGIRHRPRNYGGRSSPQRLLRLSVWISLALYFPTALWRVGTILPRVGTALQNLGQAYRQFGFSAARQGALVVVEYIRIVCGPFLALVLPLLAFYWDELSGKLRFLGILSVAGTVAITIGMGTNKMLGDTVVVAIVALAAGIAAQRIKLTPVRKGAIFLLVATAVLGMVLFFTSTQMTRPGALAVTGVFPGTGIYADAENGMVKNLPEPARIGALGLSFYVSHGYYGLYAALQQPFVPMFGIGNSIFLYQQAYRLTKNEAFLHGSYPTRTGDLGWSAYLCWSTIYPWIASDVTFPGTILIVFMIGYVFALSWLDTLRGDNPFAVALFSQFAIMFAYFPANNQCLQYGEGFFAFVGISGAWLLTRRKAPPPAAESSAPVLQKGRA